ncbi:chorismate mutase [Burkholderia sp. BCC1988]|uniref:chorismate mutase n=1 Tax=Burkholderia sp. BCC1988 TaxID=2817443 RepID=UPI002AAF5EC6|nr:chorismate mutase [Burkholderia sp. BCC1988]
MRLFVLSLIVLVSMSAYGDEPSTTQPALWGKPTVNGGACCKTLSEVRENIDRIDRQIVRLMAERGRYVHEAARFKANTAQVDAPQRAEAVVQKAMSLAKEEGLSPRIAGVTYRAMVQEFIDYEKGIFNDATLDGQAPPAR